jgi:serine/threonine protein kinase
VRGQNVDHRSDLFSFGAILYEMLSGKRAFKGDTSVETMNAILKEDAPELNESGLHVPPDSIALSATPSRKSRGCASSPLAIWRSIWKACRQSAAQANRSRNRARRAPRSFAPLCWS